MNSIEGKLETGRDDNGARQFVRTEQSFIPLYGGTTIVIEGRRGRYEGSYSDDGQRLIRSKIIYDNGGHEYLMDGDVLSILNI